MRPWLSVLFLFSFTSLSALDTRLHLANSAYIYNGENGSYWEETRTTITYLENLLEPSLEIIGDGFRFQAGAGLLFPFNQEQKLISWYPLLRTTLHFNYWKLVLGSLEGRHNLPAPLLDPLTSLTPQIRVISTSRVPLPYESFPLGLFSHGRYEYGLSLQWDSAWGGELYVNWQLPDTAQHRERFDMGLIQTYQSGYIPWYGALHYWHNGGHENPHTVSITENYNLALGVQQLRYSILYLASYWLPDRDVNPQDNLFGQAMYGRYQFSLPDRRWTIEGELFLSSELIASNQRFISIEGDPFYRMPLYAGVNIAFHWEISRELTLDLAFKNGIFWPGPPVPWDSLMIRYDQMIRLDFHTILDLHPPTVKNSPEPLALLKE